MQQGRNLIRIGDGLLHAHRAGALGTDADIDGENPGEQLGPGNSTGRRVALDGFGRLVRNATAPRGGGDGITGQIQAAPTVKEGELARRVIRVWREYPRAQGVPAIEYTVVTNQIEPRWWNEGGEPGDEGIAVEVDKRSARAKGLLELDAYATVLQGNNSVLCEGGPEQIAAQTLEPGLVAAIDSGGRVKLHAKACNRHGLGRGRGSSAVHQAKLA